MGASARAAGCMPRISSVVCLGGPDPWTRRPRDPLDAADIQQLATLPVVATLELRSRHLADRRGWWLLVAMDCLDVAGVAAVATLTTLRSLNVFGFELGPAGAEVLAGRLRQLTRLDIGQNTLGQEGVSAIAQLTGLEYLDVSFNLIRGHGLAALEPLTRLSELNAADNYCSESAAVIAAALTNLRALHLNSYDADFSSQLTDASLAALEGMPLLTLLCLDSELEPEYGCFGQVVKRHGLPDLQLEFAPLWDID